MHATLLRVPYTGRVRGPGDAGAGTLDRTRAARTFNFEPWLPGIPCESQASTGRPRQKVSAGRGSRGYR